MDSLSLAVLINIQCSKTKLDYGNRFIKSHTTIALAGAGRLVKKTNAE